MGTEFDSSIHAFWFGAVGGKNIDRKNLRPGNTILNSVTQQAKSGYTSLICRSMAGIIFGGYIEKFAHFSAQNLIEIGHIGRKISQQNVI